MDVRHREKLKSVAASRVDQGAYIRAPRRDDAVERSDDFLEVFQGLQAVDVGGCGVGQGPFRRPIAHFFVHGLLRNRIGFQHQLPPFGRGSRQFLVRSRAGEVGFGLFELVVKIGSLNERQGLSRFDSRPDVGIPGFEVPR